MRCDAIRKGIKVFYNFGFTLLQLVVACVAFTRSYVHVIHDIASNHQNGFELCELRSSGMGTTCCTHTLCTRKETEKALRKTPTPTTATTKTVAPNSFSLPRMNGEICLNMRITFASTQNKNTQPTDFTISAIINAFCFRRSGVFFIMTILCGVLSLALLIFPFDSFECACACRWFLYFSLFLLLLLFFFHSIRFLSVLLCAYFRERKINHQTSMRVLIVFLDITQHANGYYSNGKKNCFEWQIPFNGIDKNCNYNHQQCQKRIEIQT